MSLINTKEGRTVMKNASSMMVVPYVYDNALGDYALGSDVYDISAVIGDSIVIEQSEGDKVTKENEFISSPLLEVYSNGKVAMTAQCLDLQNKVLKSLFSAMTVPEHNIAAFNDDYAMSYALVRVSFRNTNTPDIIMPKVQLNSKLYIQQLKTRSGQGNISGTATSINIAVKDPDNSGHLLQFSVPTTNETTYTPFTPAIFVPRGYEPLFKYKRKDERTDAYLRVNFSNGTLSTVYVSNNGTWSNSYHPN